MIKPQELRLGNWVLTKSAYDKPTEIQVHSLGANGINETDGHAIPFDDLEGIELTPEMLAKYESRIERGEIILSSIAHRLLLSCWGEDGLCGIGNEIKCLHQLQNFIYDLTGEELT